MRAQKYANHVDDEGAHVAQFAHVLFTCNSNYEDLLPIGYQLANHSIHFVHYL